MLKRLLPAALPLIILLTAWFALPLAGELRGRERLLLSYLPHGLTAAGLLLGLRFNRARVVMVMLSLGLALWVHDRYLPGLSSPAERQLMFSALCVFLPMNITLFSLLAERGALGLHGLLRLGVIALQGLAVALALRQDATGLDGWLRHDWLHMDSLGLPLPSLSLLLFAAGALLLGLRAVRWPEPLNFGALGVLLAAFIACMQYPHSLYFPQFIGVAALLLALALLQSFHHMAYRDELTGLAARRALEERMRTLGSRYTVAMLDVDHFKRFNDKYGHDVGDDVLRMVGSLIQKVGGGGRAFRYGGEEFTVLFPRKKLGQVTPHLEVLREAIADYPLAIRASSRPKQARQGRKQRSRRSAPKTVSVTISIGVAEKTAREKMPADVVKAADRALYRAKRKGRNRVSQ